MAQSQSLCANDASISTKQNLVQACSPENMHYIIDRTQFVPVTTCVLEHILFGKRLGDCSLPKNLRLLYILVDAFSHMNQQAGEVNAWKIEKSGSKWARLLNTNQASIFSLQKLGEKLGLFSVQREIIENVAAPNILSTMLPSEPYEKMLSQAENRKGISPEELKPVEDLLLHREHLQKTKLFTKINLKMLVMLTKEKELDSSDKIIWLYFYLRAFKNAQLSKKKEDFGFVSTFQQLAEEINCSRSQISKSLKNLVQAGYISVGEANKINNSRKKQKPIRKMQCLFPAEKMLKLLQQPQRKGLEKLTEDEMKGYRCVELFDLANECLFSKTTYPFSDSNHRFSNSNNNVIETFDREGFYNKTLVKGNGNIEEVSAQKGEGRKSKKVEIKNKVEEVQEEISSKKQPTISSVHAEEKFQKRFNQVHAPDVSLVETAGDVLRGMNEQEKTCLLSLRKTLVEQNQEQIKKHIENGSRRMEACQKAHGHFENWENALILAEDDQFTSPEPQVKAEEPFVEPEAPKKKLEDIRLPRSSFEIEDFLSESKTSLLKKGIEKLQKSQCVINTSWSELAEEIAFNAVTWRQTIRKPDEIGYAINMALERVKSGGWIRPGGFTAAREAFWEREKKRYDREMRELAENKAVKI